MSWLQRKLTRIFAGRLLSEKTLSKQRRAFESQRRRAGEAHQVHYFHQVDDPYSLLSVSVLRGFLARYDIELRAHLVSPPGDEAAPERKHLQDWSRRDVGLIASAYGLEFQAGNCQPPQELVQLCIRSLVPLTGEAASGADFAEHAPNITQALWRTDAEGLSHYDADSEIADEPASEAEAQAALAAGDALREKWNYYLGAGFYYGGEWYWGVDRLHYLEGRLADLGLDRRPGEAPLCTPPASRAEPGSGDGLRLEFYPSLRSPYTAITYGRIEEFCRRTGVELITRPVLPMVMRGLPVPRQKGFYILRDTAREARRLKVGFGNIADPVGRPVERVYSLYPWAEAQGKGFDWLRVCSDAAWAEGRDLGSDEELRRCAGIVGLDWAGAPEPLADDAWREMCSQNQQQLDELGLWGVPSFRLLGLPSGDLSMWGQDRLWLLEDALIHRSDEAGPEVGGDGDVEEG
ncbi:MAG: DsbA family protein [Gammaproteobacteria bacterium AqS3]|nr:DsbA family protein [Gammaproteobacteria bacterium AqS3]